MECPQAKQSPVVPSSGWWCPPGVHLVLHLTLITLRLSESGSVCSADVVVDQFPIYLLRLRSICSHLSLGIPRMRWLARIIIAIQGPTELHYISLNSIIFSSPKGLLLFLVGSGLLAISGVHAVHLFPSWDGSELTWATLATIILGM